MTPAARVQAAIELLDTIIDAASNDGPPADRIVSDYFKARRYAGSKDRRAVADLTYSAIRHLGERPASGRAAMATIADRDVALAGLFTGEGHGPAALDPGETRAGGGPIPAWILPLIARPEGSIDRDVLLSRAPLDIRVNLSRASVADVIALLPEAAPVSGIAGALRLPAGFAVEASEAWKQGLCEIQDAGSQAIVAATCRSDGIILDLCAGAGGKTLAYADRLTGEGRIVAADINRRRLSQIPARADRAGLHRRIEPLLLDPGREIEGLANVSGACDLVIVDAPCSASGTWRRNPETRWRLTPARLRQLAETQLRLLDIADQCLAPGGRLVYIVCSLLDIEGSGLIARFLAAAPNGFRPVAIEDAGRPHGAGRLLTTCHDGTDGFFFAILERTG